MKNNNKKEKIYKTINGKIITKGAVVAECRYRVHPGFLNQALLKEHECLKKDCKHLKPNTESVFFQEREKNKKLKIKNKKLVKNIANKEAELLEELRLATVNDKNFFPISVEKEKDVDNSYIIRYISYKKISDNFYIKKFKDLTHEVFKLQEIKATKENRKAIIEKYF